MANIQSVLLVDDMEIEHMNVRYVLEDCWPDVNLHTAYDGQEALDLLASLETPPDLIFLDINMPRMDGHEFLARYKASEGECSVVVILTSSNQQLDKDRCDAYDFVKKFISKPLEELDLEVIRSFCD